MTRQVLRWLDGFTDRLGRAVAWLTLAMVGISLGVVILRYGLAVGSIALQESVLYLHGCVFLLGAGYTLQQDAHVRVDILYRRLGARARAAIDLAGTCLLLLPMCAFILWAGWDYVLQAWRIHEGSQEAGGLAFVYLLKTLIPLGTVMLALQGLAEALRAGLRAFSTGQARASG